MSEEPPFYTCQYGEIPARMGGGITRWVEDGIVPGHFLSTIITNDLKGAFEKADDDNIKVIGAYVSYFYNHTPVGCWGSIDHLASWPKHVLKMGKKIKGDKDGC